MRDRNEDEEDDFEAITERELFHGSVARNPARVRLSLLYFLRNHVPVFVIFSVVSAVLFVPLAIFVSKWCWLLFLLTALFFVFYYFGQSNHYWFGDVCPALVVSRKPDKFVVYADLTKGSVSHPAFLVFNESLGGLSGDALEEGDRFAVACLYHDTDRDLPDERWGGLHPGIIRAATANEKAVRRTLRTISKREWAMLDGGLDILPRSLKPGVYFLSDLADPPPLKSRPARRRNDNDDGQPTRRRRRD
ncbi:DUF3239 domain-containing protein [Fimbriiglobus ruber]|uniref:Uncharacterized protein n=1 Tax=Fimbriiglobus ruber TaxID=1908690 RepID=A0A225DU71_9BACT|nr:DUF3239 domain-containing protein [Fimbriiglobus ruber]OWK39677.1 hypothetical protein FRUB_05567 [Fimbriiglobus ruber]